jgi:hypothetical protein
VGPKEYLFKAPSGEKIWADGVRVENCHLRETEYAGDPKTSPFLSSSNKVHELIRNQARDEFRRYAEVIRDPRSPALGLEVITNDARAVPLFQSWLKEFGIPGHVVVKPFP